MKSKVDDFGNVNQEGTNMNGIMSDMSYVSHYKVHNIRSEMSIDVHP